MSLIKSKGTVMFVPMYCLTVRDSGGEDSGMEISTGDSTNSDNSPDNETNKFSDINGQTDSDKEAEKPRRLFRFSIVNSYGTAEMDYKLIDDDCPLKLNGKYITVDLIRKNCKLKLIFCDCFIMYLIFSAYLCGLILDLVTDFSDNVKF